MPRARAAPARCPGRSRRPARPRARGRRGPRGVEAAVEERVDAVRRREHEPLVRRSSVGQREVERLDRDRRELDHLGTERLEPRAQLARLLAGAGDDDRAAEERPLLEPREVERGDVADDDRARRLARRRRRSSRAWRAPCADRGACRCAPRRPACSASRPPSTSRCAISPIVPAPMRITSVPPDARERVPVDVGAALRRVLVPGDHGEVRRHAAVRDRDARVRRRADRARDARHDLERDAGGRAAPRPLRRRARTRTGRRPSAARRSLPVRPALDEQRVDLVLGHRRPARAPCPPRCSSAPAGASSSSVGDASRS